jgi:hypothetical protein
MRSSLPALARHFSFSFAALVAFLIVLPQNARAQNFADYSKWEIGGHYATLSLPSQCASSTGCETIDNGLGANLSWNFSAWMGLDSEMDFFGDNGDTSTETTGGHVTEGLFGIRIGPTTRKWGLYSVVRPGFVNFSRVQGGAQGGTFVASPAAALGIPEITAKLNYQAQAGSNPLSVLGLTSSTDFAFNYGEAIEYRPTKHAALRFDIGDTIVTFPQGGLGTTVHQHNFQVSEAIVIRF